MLWTQEMYDQYNLLIWNQYISEFINFDHSVDFDVLVSLKVANYTKRKVLKSK